MTKYRWKKLKRTDKMDRPFMCMKQKNYSIEKFLLSRMLKNNVFGKTNDILQRDKKRYMKLLWMYNFLPKYSSHLWEMQRKLQTSQYPISRYTSELYYKDTVVLIKHMYIHYMKKTKIITQKLTYTLMVSRLSTESKACIREKQHLK